MYNALLTLTGSPTQLVVVGRAEAIEFFMSPSDIR